MKRKNLIIDENLLKEAKRALDVDTESEAVNLSLREMVRLIKVRDLVNYVGSGVWSGSLEEMRNDKKTSPKKSTKRRA